MTQEHTITPPPELVEQWLENTRSQDCIGAYPANYEQLICTQAARWGADQELEACISAILSHPGFEQPELFVEVLRTARRSKPPSLKEEVKQIVDCLIEGDCLNDEDVLTLRRALESLPD